MIDRFNQDSHRYDDMIDMQYPYPTLRKRMSSLARGAQFAPFAALSGHDESVKEMARLTDYKIELNEQQKSMIDLKLNCLLEEIKNKPYVSVVYFQNDALKEGGAYLNKVGHLKKIDEQMHQLIFEDLTIIPMEDIYSIDSDLLNQFDF